MNSILEIVAAFLRTHLDTSKPLLLALSGGPDSLALLYLLLECRKEIAIDLHVAHVDHRWRKESTIEAHVLQNYVKSLLLPFHLKTLVYEDSHSHASMEEICRNKRLEFYESLYNEFGFQAVILGHHADDQSETILKRIFEGASFSHLSAMHEVSSFGKLTLWRPLLSFRKSEILKFSTAMGLQPIEDKTNLDTKYLRGKLRSSILPGLVHEFGKDIVAPLLRLGKDVELIANYVNSKIESIWKRRLHGPFGVCLDCRNITETVELQFLIRKLAEEQRIGISYQVVEKLQRLVKSLAANKKIEGKNHVWFVDRGYLFLMLRKNYSIEKGETVLIEDGANFGGWRVVVSKVDSSPHSCKQNWQSAWQGRVDLILPEHPLLSKSSCYLAMPNKNCIYPGKKDSLDVWWTKRKVPAFLRSIIPAIFLNNQIYMDILGGVLPKKCDLAQEYLMVSLILDL